MKYQNTLCKSGRNLRHGMRYTRFYGIYNNLIQRCINKNATQYKDYGGRGIKSFWTSFEEFKNDMHGSYLDYCDKCGEKKTFIDRIDNNKDYNKENCRWTSRSLNNNNKRNHNFLTYKGKTKNLAEWARQIGLNYKTIRTRFEKEKPINQILSPKLLI